MPEREYNQTSLANRGIDFIDLLNSLNVGVVAIDQQGVIFFWNAEAQEIFGWTPEEIVGENLEAFSPDYITPKDIARVKENVDQEWEGEFTLYTKAGRKIVTSARFAPLFTTDGVCTGTAIALRDITQRVKIEQEEERYIDIINTTPDFIGMATTDGKSTYINGGGRRLIGLTHTEDITGVPILDFHPDWVKEIIEGEALPTAIQEGIWRGETALLHAQGTEIPVSQIIMAHHDSEGRATHLSTIARDISDQKAFEHKLQEQRDKLTYDNARNEAVLRALGEGLIVIDREGYVLMVNQAFTELTGWDEDEVRGHDMADVIKKQNEAGDEISFKDMVVSEVLAGSEIATDITAPYYFMRKDGTRFPVSVSVSPIEVDGEIIGAVEVFRDITREKEIDSAKSEFVSLASHQLRTPLSTINWYVEMLLAGDMGELKEAQQKYLEEVYQSNLRMIELVNALLNVSRIEMGTLAVEPQDINLADIAREVIDDLQAAIVGKELHIQENYDPTATNLQADRRLMLIIFQNLISNAVKYTPPEGDISITIEPSSDDQKIRIRVSDTGYGIPDEAKEDIFTKLFRADNVAERDATGTGLGLYITKAIVEIADGEIWFESEEEVGTTFFVELPRSGMRQRTGEKRLTFTEIRPKKDVSVNL